MFVLPFMGNKDVYIGLRSAVGKYMYT